MRIAPQFVSAYSSGPVAGVSELGRAFQVGIGGLHLTEFSTPTADVRLGSFVPAESPFTADVYDLHSSEPEPFLSAFGVLSSISLVTSPAPTSEPATLPMTLISVVAIGRAGWKRRRRTHRRL